MFNVGGMELLVIALVALIVLGPEKLPGAIRQVGQVVGQLKKMSESFQVDLKGALDDAEREAEAVRQANAAAPDRESIDPGAAQAAAQAELAAAEAALGEHESSSADDADPEADEADPETDGLRSVGPGGSEAPAEATDDDPASPAAS